MKTCIWCRKTSNSVTFNNKAHTIPQKLGGKHICENVCDQCNLFFGSHHDGMPSVETILKETFNISRIRLLDGNHIGKNKAVPKFSSIYFNVNLQRNTINIKPAYKVHSGFQQKVCRQMKKGIYKMFLEEKERQQGNALDERFDFIRKFARHDIGDYPVINFERSFPVIAVVESWTLNPELIMIKDGMMQYLVEDPDFFEFEFLGHVLSIPTSPHWLINFDNYIIRSSEAKVKFFKRWKMVQQFNDIDLTLSILNDPE